MEKQTLLRIFAGENRRPEVLEANAEGAASAPVDLC
jgi:hypothetical protein